MHFTPPGDNVRLQTLQRARAILGGTPQLRKYLKVSAFALGVWLAGIEKPPVDVFLKAVDVVVDSEVEKLRRKS